MLRFHRPPEWLNAASLRRWREGSAREGVEVEWERKAEEVRERKVSADENVNCGGIVWKLKQFAQ